MANATFNALVSGSKAIVFNPSWANKTGYFDHAVKGASAPSLAVGETGSTEDQNGRKIVLVGTEHGNVVLFQRHSGNAPDGVIVWNASNAFQSALADEFPMSNIGGRLSEQDVSLVYEYISGTVLA